MPSDADIETAVRAALAAVKDPCMVAGGLDLSIIDLGLISALEVNQGRVDIRITFTEVGCQFTHRVIDSIYTAVEALAGVEDVSVTPAWDKAWTPEWMTPAGQEAFAAAKDRFAGRLAATASNQ
jgi:metal-sulfur cluster biosynthetic enzyme